eukprot:gene13395-15772_t
MIIIPLDLQSEAQRTRFLYSSMSPYLFKATDQSGSGLQYLTLSVSSPPIVGQNFSLFGENLNGLRYLYDTSSSVMLLFGETSIGLKCINPTQGDFTCLVCSVNTQPTTVQMEGVFKVSIDLSESFVTYTIPFIDKAYFANGESTMVLSGYGFSSNCSLLIDGVHSATASTVSVKNDTVSFPLAIPRDNQTHTLRVATPSGWKSNTFSFVFSLLPTPSPTLPPPSNINITNASTNGSIITINGINMDSIDSVNIDGKECQNLTTSESLATCFAPPGVGTNHSLVIVSKSQVASSYPFAYNAPLISFTTIDLYLNIQGSDFGPDQRDISVQLGSETRTDFALVSDSLIRLAIPYRLPNKCSLRVVVAGQASNEYLVSIPPSIISTSNVTVDGGLFTLNGTYLSENDIQVTVGGIQCTNITFTNHTDSIPFYQSLICLLPPMESSSELSLTLVVESLGVLSVVQVSFINDKRQDNLNESSWNAVGWKRTRKDKDTPQPTTLRQTAFATKFHPGREVTRSTSQSSTVDDQSIDMDTRIKSAISRVQSQISVGRYQGRLGRLISSIMRSPVFNDPFMVDLCYMIPFDKIKSLVQHLTYSDTNGSEIVVQLPLEMFIEDLNIRDSSKFELCGKGGQHSVYKGIINGFQRVIKVFEIPECLVPDDVKLIHQVEERFAQETAFLISVIGVKNFAQIVGISINNKELCIVMEYYELESLQSILQDPRKQEFIQFLPPIEEIMSKLFGAMHYLEVNHPLQYIHKDLTPSNIFVGYKDKVIDIVIGDFGISKARSSTSSLKTMTLPVVLNAAYSPPEGLMEKPKISPAFDVYQLANIYFELIARVRPLIGFNKSQYAMIVSNGHRASFPVDTPKEVQQLITSCWNQNPKKRPSFKSALDQLATLPSMRVETDLDKQLSKNTYIDDKVLSEVFKHSDTETIKKEMMKEIDSIISTSNLIQPQSSDDEQLQVPSMATNTPFTPMSDMMPATQSDHPRDE